MPDKPLGRPAAGPRSAHEGAQDGRGRAAPLNPSRAALVTPGMNRHSLAAGTAVLALVLAACSSSKKPATHSTAPGPPTGIIITGYTFSGALTVKPGQQVTVTNNDPVKHTLTQVPKHLFDTGSIDGGATRTFTAPSTPGQYTFGCTFHRNMAGTLIVQG